MTIKKHSSTVHTVTDRHTHTRPHHCSIIRSNTRLTFKSESRLKSDSTKGADGGVRGRRPDVRVSSQSAASNSVGARRFRDFPLDDRGEVQMGGGGGAGITWLGFITAGDGGSSSRREEQSGEGRKLSSLCSWEAWDWSAWEGGGGGGGGDGPRTGCSRDLWSETLTESEREVFKRIRQGRNMSSIYCKFYCLLIMRYSPTQVIGSSRMSSMDCRGSIYGQKNRKTLKCTVCSSARCLSVKTMKT